MSLSRIIRTSVTKRHFAATNANYIILGNDDAFAKVKDAPGKKVYYFTASWCPPCKAIAPKFEKYSKEFPNISFIKIDVDDLPETARDHQIQSVPTFIFLDQSKRIAQFSGASDANLSQYLGQLSKE